MSHKFLIRKFGRPAMSLPFLLSHTPAISHSLKILARSVRPRPPQN
jgi:hypothetical protein